MEKNQLTKSPGKQPAKTESKPAAAQVSVVGAPELVMTRASDKGVSCVVKNVRLTWVFVKDFREDRNDWTKGTKSVTMLVPKKSAGAFQRALGEAVKQTVALNKKIVDGPAKMEVYKTAIAVNAEGSLLKDGDEARDAGGNPRAELAGFLTWQVKKTAKRDSKTAPFAEQYPIAFQDATGRAIEPAFIDREIYSGVYCDVGFTLATYEVNGNQGVTAYLNGLRKVRDGQRLGGFNPFDGVAPSATEVEGAADVDFL